jgi:hypothetical protein
MSNNHPLEEYEYILVNGVAEVEEIYADISCLF